MGFWRETDKWIVAFDPEREPYCALVGGADWSFELTRPETVQLLAALVSLLRQWQVSLAELMDGESAELGVGNLYVELNLSGTAAAFGLRLRMVEGRAAEGSWPAPIAAQVIEALEQLAGAGLLSGLQQ
ncbi:DUF1818 family protein [Gloeobacter violaceus]|uniref:Glr1399 protein n=1 Tax=Gloeobacter violaceus (strain ATCC 29082 / PCC 7421) TaxID=251221 RepID=Q7NKS8_GLOVI|nr:DUF1818 family protein [Gloeobacter violaceus]BAC89340.1 glr1399 [Gloeobacter violaceus PCC 7421]